ncbi:O-antigen ligase family protein [Rubellicoccus peritrichatus]|uniref:O-antigen ligase family protein n=1 Tax=Rubellicoccus peritrichatus TaxID=3080537 RepID=A0AAQ3LA14_9BACT|nr:O-antigen ligase family protein [Puniceicoccus sp. CR14]WOO41591.1 O-antigen ligase family protein [Puniceicoccus sp. CR14]
MPSKLRYLSRSRITFFGNVTLSNCLDWLVTLNLAGLLAIITLQLGGVRAETQLLGLWLCSTLLILHGFWVLTAKSSEKIAINGRVLAFIPLIIYLIVSWQFLSPTPWTAATEALMWVQAFVILWVSVHNLHSRNHIWFIFLILGGVALGGVMMAFNQYFRQPEWLPKLYNPLEGESFRIRGHAQYAGRASGPFGSPNSFAGLMILAFFPAAVAAFSKHLMGILRLFSAYIGAMALVGLILTISRGGMLAILPCLFLLPLVVRAKRRTTLLVWVLILVSCMAFVVSLFYFSPRMQERWETFAENSGETTRPQMWEAGMQIFSENPATGSGLGTFRYFFELNRPEGFLLSPVHAHNDYVEALSDLGIIGFALIFLPALYFIYLGIRSWWKQPDLIALDERGENRRRLRRMPVTKLFLGAVLLSIFALALHAMVEFHLHVTALLFWIAFFFGILLKCTPPKAIRMPNRILTKLVYLAVALAAGLLLTVGNQNRYIANIYAFEGERMAKEFASNFDELRGNEQFVESRIEFLEAALEKNPEHGDARSHLALAYADKSYTDPMHRIELGQTAEEHARIAIEAFDASPHYWVNLGEALFLQERWAEAGEAYETAVELSPNNPTVWYYYANWLNGESGRRDDAMKAIERSLKLDPHNDKAIDLRRKVLIP